MVAQWTGKDRQHGNAIVPLLVGPQGSGKTTFCRRLLPEWLQTYFNDRLSMKNDNDIFIAMLSYALIREGRQYWFDDADNERIIRQNMDFQRVDDYEKMVLLTYLSPADTPADVPFVPLRDVMDTLAARFPTFVISKNTDRELGRRLKMMGY